ncbi:MAG TPA: DNA polymerase III subunit gamma/tau [Ferruginibacter sp.]|nr:DNA polymerase III subunit gamma/tau [Chitinophagaceae bacterium]HQW92364.1 DNA polymerase III subunit gamma/tau [Ferruginibacter sp.]
MDKFIVSARKYRPQNFSTVVGQAHITTTLKNAITNNQLAHAFLFCGPRGVGKTTCARILAKTINCENQTPDGEACNTCNSCVSFDAGISLNIHELDAASNNSVDDIRTLVEQVRFAPQAGKYKVYIVDEVHMLSSNAFNAFLKTLEEPPPFAIFILATTEKHKIIPTILSRCQIFDFKRITNHDTIDHLQEICDKEKIKAEKAALHVIAQKSEGCLRDALSILDKIVSFTNGELTYSNTLEHLNILDEDYYFKLMEYMQQQQLSDAMLLYDEINRKGFEGDTLLEGYSEFIRNLLVSKDAKAAILLEVADDFKQKYLQAAQQISSGWLIAALNLLNEAEINYKQARNKRLHVELAIIKLCYLLQAVELVNNEGTVAKKKVVETAKPVAFRSIRLIRVKEQEIPVALQTAIKKNEAALQGEGQATLIIEEPLQKIQQTVTRQEVVLNTEPKKSLGSLDAIRKKVTAKNNANGNTVKELTEEALKLCWEIFIEKLIAKKNHSAVTNFKMAELKIIDNNTIEIVTENNIQQKFIEQERAELVDDLQQYFCNRQLTYSVTILEKEGTGIETEKPLSSRDQYLKIVEAYPLVKELKDRLRLELDY